MPLGEAVKQVSDDATALAKLELELARREVGRKGAQLAGVAAIGGTAAVLALFAIGFGLAAAAAGLAEALPTWLAILCVAGGLAVVATVAGVAAVSLLRRTMPVVPRRTIDEARLTLARIKESSMEGNGRP